MPALSGYGAVAMNVALTASMSTLPEQLRKTLTWDRGKELSEHAQFALDTGAKVFFADPHSPWQGPTNENTNGLLRQHFSKGTDLSRWTAEDLAAVAYTRSTTGHGKRSAGRRQPKSSPSSYDRTSRCCDDRLNPPSTCRRSSPSSARGIVSGGLWVGRGFVTIMRGRNRSMVR